MENPKKNTRPIRENRDRREFEIVKIDEAKKTRRKRSPRIMSTFNKIMVLFIAVLAFVVMYEYSRIGNLKDEVENLNKEVMISEGNRDLIKSKIDSRLTNKNIEELAKNNLGMQFPENSQIIYLDLKDK